MGCRGTTCFPIVFSRSCREICASVSGAHRPLPPLTLVSAGLLLSYFSYSSLTAAVQHFLLFLKYIITEAPLALLMGSALSNSRSVLELDETGSVRRVGSFWCLFAEGTPAALHSVKILPHKPKTGKHVDEPLNWLSWNQYNQNRAYHHQVNFPTQTHEFF